MDWVNLALQLFLDGAHWAVQFHKEHFRFIEFIVAVLTAAGTAWAVITYVKRSVAAAVELSQKKALYEDRRLTTETVIGMYLFASAPDADGFRRISQRNFTRQTMNQALITALHQPVCSAVVDQAGVVRETGLMRLPHPFMHDLLTELRFFVVGNDTTALLAQAFKRLFKQDKVVIMALSRNHGGTQSEDVNSPTVLVIPKNDVSFMRRKDLAHVAIPGSGLTHDDLLIFGKLADEIPAELLKPASEAAMLEVDVESVPVEIIIDLISLKIDESTATVVARIDESDDRTTKGHAEIKALLHAIAAKMS